MINCNPNKRSIANKGLGPKKDYNTKFSTPVNWHVEFFKFRWNYNLISLKKVSSTFFSQPN